MRWLVALFGLLALTAFALWLRPGHERSRGTRDDRAADGALAIPSESTIAVELRPSPPPAPDAAPDPAPDDGAPVPRESVATADAMVAGRVEVEGGIPAGESVVVVGLAHRTGVSRLRARRLETPVALDGSFALRVPADTQGVELELAARLLVLEPQSVVPPGTLDVVLRPKALALVQGRAHLPPGLGHSASATPMTHVSAGRTSSGYADAYGGFELVVEANRAFELVATTEDPNDELEWPMEARVAVDALRPFEVRWIDAHLEQWFTVRGIVTDADGAPLENATVQLTPEHKYGTVVVARAEPVTTGADGMFVLGPLRPGTNDLLASAEGHGTERRTIALPEDVHALLHFTLARAATVRGRVLSPDGMPVAGAIVYDSRNPEERALGSWARTQATAAKLEVSRGSGARERMVPFRVTQTDEDGAFTYTCSAGKVMLVAKAEGFADSLPLELRPDAGEERGDVVLTLRRTCSLRVRVSSDGGLPASLALTLGHEDGSKRVLAAFNGIVEAHGLPPGRARIEGNFAVLDEDSEARARYMGGVDVELAPEVVAEAELHLTLVK